MAQPFLIFGHRGSPGRYRENTLSSFDEALRAGADGFETDLRLLADKTTVLFHDDELAEEEIESLTLDECAARGAKITLLKDLARYAGRTTMVLEVKRSKWEDALLAEIGKWPNIIVASFDHSTIAELSRRQVSFPLGITTYGYIVDIARYAASVGACWCFPAYHYVDREMVRSLHDRGIKVVPYTPNRPREWQRLRDAGCDGVITDLPHEAVEWRKTA
jgi:glycerophosphoryl diester phosphodiesterase